MILKSVPFNSCLIYYFIIHSFTFLLNFLSPELPRIEQLPEHQLCSQQQGDQCREGPAEAVLHPIPGFCADLVAEGQPGRQLQNHHGGQ